MRNFDCGIGRSGQPGGHKVSQGTGCEIINGCFFESDEHLSGLVLEELIFASGQRDG